MVVESAYAACVSLAGRHYENFPVASRLLPRALRPHIAAIYAFARIADDFADEGQRPAATRLALLDDWQDRLQRALAGQVANDNSDAAAVFVALADTIDRFALEPELFIALLSAFRQDVLVTRYDGWTDLLDYCERSANPVGRLVLRISGYRDAGLDRMSDAVCTALQLTNFWQDLDIDWRRGRLYVPGQLVASAGADLNDLGRRRLTPEWRAVMTAAVAHTRAQFEQGRGIADAVTGRLRWELRATWLGGMRVLERLEAVNFDVFRARPTVGWRDAVPLTWRLLAWRRHAA